MFVPQVQPIATFATKDAAPGKISAELVLEAVLKLHRYGSTVIAVISDGAGNNRSIWQQLGVSGSVASSCYEVPYPFFHVDNF